MKKGFTLIELLAVIILLALISAISIPAVTEHLKDSKQNVAETSALNYISSVETYLKASVLDKKMLKLKDGENYNLTEETVIDGTVYPPITNIIEFRGAAPTAGSLQISNNKVSMAQIDIYDYRITYSKENKIVNTESLK